MAVYRRYNRDDRRAVRRFCIWLCAVLIVLALTALLGTYHGRRAENSSPVPSFSPSEAHGGETVAPIAEHIVHGEYVEPTALAAALAAADPDADPYAHASVWLYKDGAATFATDADALLGRDTAALPTKDALRAGNVTGLFEVRSVYAAAEVRDVLFAYECALLREYAAAGIGEITLVFDRLDADCLADVTALAAACPGAVVLCVPFDTLTRDVCADFFTAAEAGGCSVALAADGIGKTELAESIEDYAFYFTKYNLRLVLDGTEEDLLEVLREKSMQSYQFRSARPTPAVTADPAETTPEETR